MCTHSLTRIQLFIIAVTCGLLGSSMLLMGHHRHIELVTDFYGISQLLTGHVFNNVAALSLISLAVLSLISIVKPAFTKFVGISAVIVATVPLLALFADSMWIPALGGFPAIGSGQGVIKYFSLAVIGLLLWQPNWIPHSAKKWLSLFPVVLVLVWIGGMKFTEIEAQGIEVLVKTSPLMAWMYNVWDLQTTSNIIGVYDLMAVVLLVMAIKHSRLLLPAIVMSGAVFVVTQTFLWSWPDAVSAKHILSTGGHFLIKDIWYIANLVCFWHFAKR